MITGRSISSVLVSFAVVSLVLAGSAAPATAAGPPLECGDTVEVSTTLTTDLHCSGPIGLTVQPGATLDLGGHTVSGSGSGTGVVLVGLGRTEVRNGTVAEWRFGVNNTYEDAETGQLVTVDSVTLTRNETAMSVVLTNFAVRSSTLSRNATAIDSFYAPGTVKDSVFTRNTVVGIDVSQARVQVSGSRFTDNPVGATCYDGWLEVTTSTFLRNEDGVSGGYCGGFDISRSTFIGNDRAYIQNDYYGFGSDEITDNRFLRNGTAVDTDNSATLRGNYFAANGTGLRVRPNVEKTTASLIGNFFTLNGDGAIIMVPATLKNNVAIANAGYGIRAPQATDLGGNFSWGNGTSQTAA